MRRIVAWAGEVVLGLSDDWLLLIGAKADCEVWCLHIFRGLALRIGSFRPVLTWSRGRL